MAAINFTQHSNTKKIRQPPAVPFLWELKPGMPRKDWKPEVLSVIPLLTTPTVKLIASVPFDWEEKPGTPLPCFSQQPLEPLEPVLAPPPGKHITFPSSPACHQGYNDDNDDDFQKYVESDDADDDRKGLSELDLEAFDFETDDSFNSVPSLLANCLVPSLDISSAVPMQISSSGDDASDQLEIPSSPTSETASSTSSYATVISSLVGVSFLECLFPLLPPNSGFLEKVGCSEKGFHTPAEGKKSKDFDRESYSSVVIRKPTTLGELIMMSRRRSCQRKAAQMRKQNLSMEFAERASRCGIIGTSFKMIQGLQRKMCQPILKLLKE